MKPHLVITILICTVNCEWVEITPIKTKKYLSGSKNVGMMTTENYENIMKNPIPNTEFVTSPMPSYVINENFTNFGKNHMGVKTTTEKISSDSDTNSEYFYTSDDHADFEKKDDHGIEGFLPLLKTIQSNLLKFKKTHKSKMSVLKHLRDHLLVNIKGLITHLWKPKVSAEARGYNEEDSHMDFPSNEGALMTIGFLTFAVFLIKLVIKLIHTLKYKQQVYEMTTTTTAASVVFVRRKRDQEQEEMNKILQYIEEF